MMMMGDSRIGPMQKLVLIVSVDSGDGERDPFHGDGSALLTAVVTAAADGADAGCCKPELLPLPTYWSLMAVDSS